MKFTEGNNWGFRIYWVGEHPLTRDNSHIEIMLDNGWHRFKIDWRQSTDSVSDHGDSYEVTSDVPYITIVYEGVSLSAELVRFQEKEMRIPQGA